MKKLTFIVFLSIFSTASLSAQNKYERIKPRPIKKEVFSQKFGFGFGLAFPDYLPLEVRYIPHPMISFKAFYVPNLPYNVKLEYEPSILSSKGGLVIENPYAEGKFKGDFGPQFGLDIKLHPFSSGFYLGFGGSSRELGLSGALQTPLILSSSGIKTTTNTEVRLETQLKIRQNLARFSMGWFWYSCQKRCFIDFTFLGISSPLDSKSSIGINTEIINPKATVEIENDALEAAEDELSLKLETSAKKSLKPIKTLSLPIIGISWGILF